MVLPCDNNSQRQSVEVSHLSICSMVVLPQCTVSGSENEVDTAIQIIVNDIFDKPCFVNKNLVAG